MIAIQTLTCDDWQTFRKLRLEALREAPYAFATRLSTWQNAGDTEGRWRARLTDVPFNAVAELDGDRVGLVSATDPENHATLLISMWVAPQARGRGVGDALISAVFDWAREQHIGAVRLEVRSDNRHAIDLYARNGFVDVGEKKRASADELAERVMLCELSPRGRA